MTHKYLDAAFAAFFFFLSGFSFALQAFFPAIAFGLVGIVAALTAINHE